MPDDDELEVQDEAYWAEHVSGLLWNHCELYGWKDVIGLDLGEVLIHTGDGKTVTLSISIADTDGEEP